MHNRIHEILKQYWGYDEFRSLQEEIILSVLEGKDTLALMPTGGGKSITYQVPALVLEGICLVVPGRGLPGCQSSNRFNERSG